MMPSQARTTGSPAKRSSVAKSQIPTKSPNRYRNDVAAQVERQVKIIYIFVHHCLHKCSSFDTLHHSYGIIVIKEDHDELLAIDPSPDPKVKAELLNILGVGQDLIKRTEEYARVKTEAAGHRAISQTQVKHRKNDDSTHMTTVVKAKKSDGGTPSPIDESGSALSSTEWEQ